MHPTTPARAKEKLHVDDHFSPMEDALFRELDEDASLDALLDALFPTDA